MVGYLFHLEDYKIQAHQRGALQEYPYKIYHTFSCKMFGKRFECCTWYSTAKEAEKAAERFIRKTFIKEETL